MKKMQPWPLGIAVLFVLFVTFQIGLIATVSHGFEGPDDVQYYRNGLEFSRQVAQQRRQESLGWRVETNVGAVVPAHFALVVTARDARGGTLPDARVSVEVGRPATRRDDARYGLKPVGEHFSVPLTLAPGAWELKLTVRAAGETWMRKIRTSVEHKT
ncbi:MAG: hypothetical protein FJX76_12220 [Armatimonadetes bacterium]|nr:hypothetical protein [Armatimonadota bacterium]